MIKIHLKLYTVYGRKKFKLICEDIASISPFIRFVGVIGERGELLAYKRRPDLTPLLDEKNTKYQFSHIAMKTDLEGFFDKNLGEVEFVWEERKKVQTISFAIKKAIVWVSIDKKVIRSEMLRIIDSCLPIVKNILKLKHLKCPYCEIDLDSLSMTDGLKHILEHKKENKIKVSK